MNLKIEILYSRGSVKNYDFFLGKKYRINKKKRSAVNKNRRHFFCYVKFVWFFYRHCRSPTNQFYCKKRLIGGKTVEISAKKGIHIRKWQLSGDYISRALPEPAV